MLFIQAVADVLAGRFPFDEAYVVFIEQEMNLDNLWCGVFVLTCDVVSAVLHLAALQCAVEFGRASKNPVRYVSCLLTYRATN
jgi:hypothetical protein